MPLTLWELAEENARRYPHHTAVVCDEARLSYSDLEGRALLASAALTGLGVGSGDRVVWLGQNCHRLLEVLLACGRLGASLCPLNWRMSPDELAWVVGDLEPSVVLTQEAEIGDRVAELRALVSSTDAAWVAHDAIGPGSYESLLAEASPPSSDAGGAGSDPDDDALLLYTAAFEGRPRAARISHTALLLQSLVVWRASETTSEDRFLNSGPLFHIATLMDCVATFVIGGTNVMLRRPDALEIARLIDEERCTAAYLIQPLLGEVQELGKGRYDLSSLRRPRLSAPDEDDPSRDAPRSAHPGGYGQTQTAGPVTWKFLGPDAAGTHGRSAPVALVRILDDDGVELPTGVVGEIAVRGPLAASGYWLRNATESSRDRMEWFRTNDLGRRESDGSITFVGPKQRMIRSGGENIYPAEVEACLRGHPEVVDCAVIGIPSQRWGQDVKAVVVLKPGSRTTLEDLAQFCSDRIASYKKPKSVVFVDELPRRGWAVDYERLDQDFGGGGYPGEG